MKRGNGRLALSTIIAAVVMGCRGDAIAKPEVASATRMKIAAPNPFMAELNTPFRLTATTYDTSDAVVQTDVQASWQSADTSIALVDTAGVLVGRRLGTTYVRARLVQKDRVLNDSIVVTVVITRAADF